VGAARGCWTAGLGEGTPMSFVNVALAGIASLVGFVMLLRPQALLLGTSASSDALRLIRNLGVWRARR
jgi:hypothetical protein